MCMCANADEEAQCALIRYCYLLINQCAKALTLVQNFAAHCQNSSVTTCHMLHLIY